MAAPLLAGSIQPAILTLLSSTSHPALSPLWTSTEGLADSSFIEVLRDDEYPGSSPEVSSSSSPSSSSRKASPRDELHVPRHPQRGSLPVSVIHLQSPKPDTFIRTRGTLGVTLPYFSAQIKPFGKRGMSIEIEMVDTAGKRGVVRLSSWKKQPTLHASRSPPLLHLPLALPEDRHKLTDWAELNVYLPPIMSLFRTLTPEESKNANSDSEASDDSDGDRAHGGWRGRDGYRKRSYPHDHRARSQKQKHKVKYELPASFVSTASVRIYASCRVRRVWFSAEGDRSLDAAGVREEWALRVDAV